MQEAKSICIEVSFDPQFYGPALMLFLVALLRASNSQSSRPLRLESAPWLPGTMAAVTAVPGSGL
jgi:hypothetical protein